jgi:hypothetical protein
VTTPVEETLAVDRLGRAIKVPAGQPLPEGAQEVDQATWDKIMAGAPRVYTKVDANGQTQYSMSQGGMTWAPTYSPGPGWEEVTDPDEIERILDLLNGGGREEEEPPS